MALGDRYLPSVQLVSGATRGALCHHTVKNGGFRTWVPCELEEVSGFPLPCLPHMDHGRLVQRIFISEP